MAWRSKVLPRPEFKLLVPALIRQIVPEFVAQDKLIQVAGFGCQVPGVGVQVPDVSEKSRKSSLRHLTPGAYCSLAPGTGHPPAL